MTDKLDSGHLLVMNAHHILTNFQILLVDLFLELVEVGHGASLEGWFDAASRKIRRTSSMSNRRTPKTSSVLNPERAKENKTKVEALKIIPIFMHCHLIFRMFQN